MVMLNAGYKPLVEVSRGMDKMAIVLQEILEDKIYLSDVGQVQSRAGNSLDLAERAMMGDISTDLGGD